jgi:23S rRNA G2069 N7-methylase RlmK/C1962 C5-methylase RlmI
MLKRAVRAERRDAWTLGVHGASPDHPVLLAMPETAYLTCAVLRVF